MAVENFEPTKQRSKKSGPSGAGDYDPFMRGRFPVGVRTIRALDAARGRPFPCEVWYPAAARHAGQDSAPGTQDLFTVPPRDTPRSQMAVRDAAALPGTYPLIIFSHHSGGHRRAATFLCTHLGSHGYVVAALDHSEVVAAELARREGETDDQRAARVDAMIASRVPDVRFLLDHLLNGAASESEALIDGGRVGVVGHSFGGWTALAATEVEPRIRAVVALAPGGNSRPRPGILPVTLTFAWGRDVPTLYLAAENDTPIPLAGLYELFQRTPATKQMVILRRADHAHFMDNVEQEHESIRAMPFSGELAWIPKEMLPISELCSGEQAHLFVRGLTLCHMDAVLKQSEEARRFLAGDIEGELAARGVDVIVHKP
jgi:dienelactone hydrolase